MKRKIFAILLAALLLLTAVSCTGPTETSENPGTNPDASPQATVIDKDREGNSITLPETIDKIITLGASNNEILVALGCGDKIVATDTFSTGIPEISADLLTLDMSALNGEAIIALDADVIIATGMIKAVGIDPLEVVKDMGVCVIYVPSSQSIAAIKEDIRFLAAVMDKSDQGEAIVAEMEQEIEAIRAIGSTITDKKTVFFDMGAYESKIYSLAEGTFIHEMIELIGAENAVGDQEGIDGWLALSDEVALASNPDIILTSAGYPGATDDIKSRPGWDAVTAVKNNAVYDVDANASNRPDQNITKALKQMAKLIYPDLYK